MNGGLLWILLERSPNPFVFVFKNFLPPHFPKTDQIDAMTAVQLKALCKEQGLKVSGKKDELKERLREHFLSGGLNDNSQKGQQVAGGM